MLSSCVVLTLGVSVGLWDEIGSLFGDIFLRQDAIYMARNDVESKQETLWSAWGDWLLDFAGLLPPTVSSYLSDPFPNHRSLLLLLSSSPSLSLLLFLFLPLRTCNLSLGAPTMLTYPAIWNTYLNLFWVGSEYLLSWQVPRVTWCWGLGSTLWETLFGSILYSARVQFKDCD